MNDEFGELLGRECGAEVVKGVVVSDDEGSSWGPLDLDVREAFPVRHSPGVGVWEDLVWKIVDEDDVLRFEVSEDELVRSFSFSLSKRLELLRVSDAVPSVYEAVFFDHVDADGYNDELKSP